MTQSFDFSTFCRQRHFSSYTQAQSTHRFVLSITLGSHLVHGAPLDLVPLGQPREEGPGLGVLDELRVCGGGRAEDGLDLLDEVEVVLAGEDGPVAHHLGEDAAHGPHVHADGVALYKENLKIQATRLLIRLHI